MPNPDTTRSAQRTPVLPTRPAALQPAPRTTVPTRVLEPRRAPQQLSLLFTR